MEALVSVVIPSYNRGRVLGEALESVFAQTYPRLEVIVVDDGSTDDTAEVVARFGDRLTYIRQDNQGLAGARNTGLARATGTYVAWLDSDDLWNPGKIALQVAFLERHPECVLTATDFSAFGEGGYFEASHIATYYSVLRKTPGGLAGIFSDQEELDTTGLPHMAPDVPAKVIVHHGTLYPQIVQGNCLHPPTALFRRDAAERAGRLDKTFRGEVDWEYFVRFSREGRVAVIATPLMRYRHSADQMSSDAHLASMAVGRMLVLDAIKQRDPALFKDRAFRRRIGSSHLAVAGVYAESQQRARAAGHLFRSLACGYADATTVRTVAKLCLPQWAIKRLKKQPGATA